MNTQTHHRTQITTLFAATILTLCALPTEASSSQTQDREVLKQVIDTVASPAELSKIIKDRVRYKRDKNEHWQTGAETWERKRGDCEDFAILMTQLCEAKGFNVQMQCYRAKGKGHAIAVGKWEGTYWMSSNGDFTTVSGPQEIKALMASYLNRSESQLSSFTVGRRALAYELTSRKGR